MIVLHPTTSTPGGNRGLPMACPVCKAPALEHDDGSVYCSETGQTYRARDLAGAVEAQLLAELVQPKDGDR